MLLREISQYNQCVIRLTLWQGAFLDDSALTRSASGAGIVVHTELAKLCPWILCSAPEKRLSKRAVPCARAERHLHSAYLSRQSQTFLFRIDASSGEPAALKFSKGAFLRDCRISQWSGSR